MTHLLATVYSPAFIIGLLAGIVGQRIYCWQRAKWMDRHHPNADGSAHPIGGLDRMWIGGLVALAILGYVLLQAQETHNDTVALSERTLQCQADLIRFIERSRDISAQNDELSVRQRKLFADLDELQGVWLTRVVSPDNPEIAALDVEDPRREAWAFDVTIVYNERAAKVRAEVRAITEEQDRLADERQANELPDPRCGQ